VQILKPGAAAGDRCERPDEPRQPGHHLDDHLRQPNPREHHPDQLAQLGQARRIGNRLQRREVKPAVVVDCDLGARGDSAGDLPVGRVERPRVAIDQLRWILGQSERSQHRPLRVRPRLAREQLRARVAPPRRLGRVDVAALEVPVKLGQHAEHVRVAVDRSVRRGLLPVHQPPPRAAHQAPVDVLGRQRAAPVKQPRHPPHLPEHRLTVRVRSQLDHLTQLAREPRHHPDPLRYPRADGAFVILVRVRYQLNDRRDRQAQLLAARDRLNLPPQIGDAHDLLGARRLQQLADHPRELRRSASEPRVLARPLLVRLPLGLTEQLGRHDQVKQLKAVIDRRRL